jgi:hypothetical protein
LKTLNLHKLSSKMRFTLVILFIGFLISCEQNKQEKSQTSHSLKEVKPMFENEVIFENEIKDIETNKNLVEVTSLEYLRDNGETYVVKGLVETKNENQEMTLKKLIFKKIFTNGNETSCAFYYKGTRKFVSINEQSIFKNNELIKVITKSYYDDSSKVFFSKKLSGKAENIENYTYKTCNVIEHDDNLALKIINQEGDFQTKFQGFTELDGRLFFILGTEHYTSTILFSEYNQTLSLLKKNEKKYLGKKLIVDFSVESDANGFTFQVMKNVQIAK